MNFIAPNYAVMRHAKDMPADSSRLAAMEATTTLEPGSLILLEHNCHRLTEKVSDIYKKFIVYHSPKKRAKLTAEQVVNALQKENLMVEYAGSLLWLDDNHGSISNDVIASILTKHKDAFVILISHMPNLEQYTGRTPVNCSIMAQNFMIGRWAFRD